jgi:hypothetical protein
MSWRTLAEDAICRWNKLGLDQKELAGRARVHPSVIPHVRDYPEYTISDSTAQRIADVVRAEEATRIRSIGMEVIAYCHGQEHIPTAVESSRVIADTKAALERPDQESLVQLPEGVNGVLMRVGDHQSRIFLIVLAPTEAADEKRALAHELAHLRSLILKDVEPPSAPPKSAY